MKRSDIAEGAVFFGAILGLALLILGPLVYAGAGCVSGLRRRDACTARGGIMQRDAFGWPQCVVRMQP